jgi:hypothetical protein
VSKADDKRDRIVADALAKEALISGNRWGPQQNGAPPGGMPPHVRLTAEELAALVRPPDARIRRLQRAITVLVTVCALNGALTLFWTLRIRALNAELDAARAHSPCALVASSVPMLELALRNASGAPERLRIAGAAAIVLHPVASKCSGSDSSELVQRMTEGRTLDEQLAALHALRARIQP